MARARASDVAVRDEDVATGSEVHAVGVGSEDRIAHANASDVDRLARNRPHRPSRCICQGNAFDSNVLTVGKLQHGRWPARRCGFVVPGDHITHISSSFGPRRPLRCQRQNLGHRSFPSRRLRCLQHFARRSGVCRWHHLPAADRHDIRSHSHRCCRATPRRSEDIT
jgi:hypothetical protein